MSVFLKSQNQYLEAFLKVLVFFKERGIIDDNLGVCDPKVQDLVVHRLGGLYRPYRFFEVNVE